MEEVLSAPEPEVEYNEEDQEWSYESIVQGLQPCCDEDNGKCWPIGI